MEIIQNNFKPVNPDWPKKAECYYCNSKLSVVPSDFRYENYIFSQREQERVQVFTCPCCGKIVPISWAKLNTLG